MSGKGVHLKSVVFLNYRLPNTIPKVAG